MPVLSSWATEGNMLTVHVGQSRKSDSMGCLQDMETGWRTWKLTNALSCKEKGKRKKENPSHITPTTLSIFVVRSIRDGGTHLGSGSGVELVAWAQTLTTPPRTWSSELLAGPLGKQAPARPISRNLDSC